MLSLFFNKNVLVGITVLAILGSTFGYAFNNWHTKPLKEQAILIVVLENNVLEYKTEISTLKAQKEKLLDDVGVMYDTGYNLGLREGYKHEKSNTTTKHSTIIRF